MLRIIVLLLFCSSAFAGELSPERQALEDKFNSGKEPIAIEALWTDDKVFKVGVYDDGSRRDGYAEYICMEIHDAGLVGLNILVRVIDIDKLRRTGEWVNLGTGYCK
tara:strand:+ start:10985 stop:11305 length:321 start_codon:yes stop_codon:yes gene_type:complete